MDFDRLYDWQHVALGAVGLATTAAALWRSRGAA